MSGKTNYLETQMLNHVLRNTAYSSPTTIYVALFTVAPDETGGGTEVTGGAYVRQAVVFTTPAPDSCSNNADVTYPIATGDWGTIVAFALFDQSSGGNMIYFANLTASRDILTSDQFRFPSGQLLVSED
jgi:hypothetical protein